MNLRDTHHPDLHAGNPPDDSEENAGQEPSDRPGRRGILIGSFRGIRFYLAYSWFLVAGLVVYALSTSTFPLLLHGREPAVYAAMSCVAAALFFLSILLHELGHSIVSQRCGIPVRRITLLFIGGLAEISREPDDARSELKIAIAGPAVSLVLVGVYGLLGWGLEWLGFWEGYVVFRWLAVVNLVLVIFNSVPAFPLDGGRVLRALLWMRSGKLRQATYISSRIGIAFGWLLIVLGTYGTLAYGAWNFLIFVLIGVFLKNAAESGYSNSVTREILANRTVRDLMTKAPITIKGELPLSLAVEHFFLAQHHLAFPVVDDAGEFVGLLTLDTVKQIPKEKWPFTSTKEALANSPSGTASPIRDDVPAQTALRRLIPAGSEHLAVVDANHKVCGVITRYDLSRYIEIQTQLEALDGAKNGVPRP